MNKENQNQSSVPLLQEVLKKLKKKAETRIHIWTKLQPKMDIQLNLVCEVFPFFLIDLSNFKNEYLRK